jgi:hypothetical protein
MHVAQNYDSYQIPRFVVTDFLQIVVFAQSSCVCVRVCAF